MKPQFYKDKQGFYRWRIKAKNGRIVADSGESYTSKQMAQKGFESLRKNLQSEESMIIAKRTEPTSAFKETIRAYENTIRQFDELMDTKKVEDYYFDKINGRDCLLVKIAGEQVPRIVELN